jgi:enoyl-CoA hydratase
MPTDTPEHLDIERRHHVATVWIDRPEKLNAMAPAFWRDLPEVMGRLGEDDDVRCIVIAGRGKAFSVGIDLEAFGGMLLEGAGEGTTVAQRRKLLSTIKTMQQTFTAVAECPKPVIAAVHGYCLGGAVDLITACDIRLAAADSVFSIRETKLAMVADVGTLQRLPRIVDPGRVAELVFTGKDFGAEEAEEMGLVSHVYPDRDTVFKHAGEMAEEIASNSPLAVQGAKWVLRQGAEMSIDQALDYMAVWNSSFLTSGDLAEAVRAFTEKRPPEFTGE